MFTCVTSLRRALPNLSPSQSRASPLPFLTLRLALQYTPTLTRNHATLQSLKTGHHRKKLLNELKKSNTSSKRSRQIDGSKRKIDQSDKQFEKDVQAREHNRARMLGLEDAGKLKQRNAMEEMKFLHDPLKLANTVVDTLKRADVEHALALVRASQTALDGAPVASIVSWNHIMDWLMMKGNHTAAWKVYNEMKKRGQKPDAHTYTIMLRGYRENADKANAVQHAVTIYDSIFAANSAVEPTIIHANAVLSVCARAGNVDKMWSIVGRLPDRGPRAPDSITFTTMFTAITEEARTRAMSISSHKDSDKLVRQIFEEVVKDARKLWVDVAGRWRRGDLDIDERLVCSMGRLLMLSNQPKDYEDVLRLVNQTMNLKIGNTNPATADAAHTEGSESSNIFDFKPDTDNPNVSRPSETTARSRSTAVARPISSIYATPGNNTLSMLMEVTGALHQLRVGKAYWDLLVSEEGPFHILPDVESTKTYLRLLRQSRASHLVLSTLKNWKKPSSAGSMRGVFIVAMSTCVRDKNNPSVFETASRILDIAQAYEEGNPDSSGTASFLSPKVLEMYMRLAIMTTKGLNGVPLSKKANGDLDFERDSSRNNVLKALNRLGPDTINLKRIVKDYVVDLEQQKANPVRTRRVGEILAQRSVKAPQVVQEIIDFMRVLVSAYDKILMVNEKLEDDGMGPLDEALMRDAAMQKRKLSAFMAKMVDGPKIKSARDERGVIENDGEAEDGAEEAHAVEGQTPKRIDPTVRTPQSRILKAMEREQAIQQEKEVQRGQRQPTAGLSRRQKGEFEKEIRARGQFFQRHPSVSEIIRRPRDKFSDSNARKERQDLDGTVETRSQRRFSHEQREQTGLEQLLEASQPRSRHKSGFQEERPVRIRQHHPLRLRKHLGTASNNRRSETSTVTRGWGSGFEDMARRSGQDSRIVDLGS